MQYGTKLTVCTYNVMLSVSTPFRFNGQWERLRRIPGILRHMDSEFEGVDIVVFQEVVPGAYRKYLVAGMASIGWVFSSKLIRSSLMKPANAGILICSKYPITSNLQHVFSVCSGSDCLMSKSVIYTRILFDEVYPVHLFSMHLQAWDTSKGANIRYRQLKEFHAFQLSLNLNREEPVILAGDLNIDYYTQQEYFTSVLKDIDVKLVKLHEKSHPFTSDPKTNSLVGNDVAGMYRTRKYPNGCYLDYMKHLSCPCCPRELLDYIGFSTRNLIPINSSCFVYQAKTSDRFLIKMNARTERWIDDCSDHFPLVATFVFSFTRSTDTITSTVMVQPNNYKPIVFILLVFCVTLIYLWYRYRRKYQVL